MAILITGGAGFIGTHTCVELLNAGESIVVVDNYDNSVPLALDRVRTITGRDFPQYECDIRDKAALQRVFAENEIDTVIHFAGLKAVGESCKKPLEYYDNNIGGTITLLEIMKEFSVRRMVFSSSATVYGNHPAPLVETMSTGHVTNPYGRTKYIIECILKDVYASDPSWSIALLRYFNPIGAHESGLIGEDPEGIPNNLMPYVAQVAVGKLKEVVVFGDDYDTPDGTGVRDYIHVCDLALGHVKAVEFVRKAPGLEAINLGSGRGYSVLEMIEAFEKASGKSIAYRIGDRRPGDLGMVYADAEKAKRLLDFVTTRDLKKMCEDGWNWQSHNPDGYRTKE